MPLPVTQSSSLNVTGYLIIAIAFSIMLIAAWSFFRFKTHIEPWKPTSTIITSGIFGLSRNPIYTGFCIATPGVGLVLNSWWIIISVAPLIWLLYSLVIRLEESYLLRKFGNDYRSYQQRVRRWL
ncbi:MAG: isoprenylcysteine carboxylmethyltransferase family protein [Gammaproteobacteria bacterium]|nr:isoprenylcysteine carboxylmethyltransferase family protein [Gammaproteobacteria bacterium]